MHSAFRKSQPAAFWDSLTEKDRLELLEKIDDVTLDRKIVMHNFSHLPTRGRQLVIQMFITTWRYFEVEKMMKFKKRELKKGKL